LLRVVDRAREVSALLAERRPLLEPAADEKAAVLGPRVAEDLHATDGHVGHAGDRNDGELLLPREEALHEDPEVARGHREARQDQELRELAAVHVALVGRVDRQLLAPEGLALRAHASSSMKSRTSISTALLSGGTIMKTFVRTVWRPNWNTFVGFSLRSAA